MIFLPNAIIIDASFKLYLFFFIIFFIIFLIFYFFVYLFFTFSRFIFYFSQSEGTANHLSELESHILLLAEKVSNKAKLSKKELRREREHRLHAIALDGDGEADPHHMNHENHGIYVSHKKHDHTKHHLRKMREEMAKEEAKGLDKDHLAHGAVIAPADHSGAGKKAQKKAEKKALEAQEAAEDAKKKADRKEKKAMQEAEAEKAAASRGANKKVTKAEEEANDVKKKEAKNAKRAREKADEDAADAKKKESKKARRADKKAQEEAEEAAAKADKAVKKAKKAGAENSVVDKVKAASASVVGAVTGAATRTKDTVVDSVSDMGKNSKLKRNKKLEDAKLGHNEKMKSTTASRWLSPWIMALLAALAVGLAAYGCMRYMRRREYDSIPVYMQDAEANARYLRA